MAGRARAGTCRAGRSRGLRALAALAGCVLWLCATGQETPERRWDPLAQDGIHDPGAPGLRLLQEPAEALRGLPPDRAGNLVQWVDAIESGAITPRTSLSPTFEVRMLDKDVYLDRYGGTVPVVRFPHRQHTLWLDCTNCHDHLFKPKRGANDITMLKILNGEQCGVCHGAVAFPLTECLRCHNTPSTPSAGAQRTAPGASR